MGRSRTSALTPLLRSEAVARVLSTIVLAPEALHLQAIADQTELAYSVVQREVERLEKAGVLRSERIGRLRLVRADESHPMFPELRALLLKAYGPLSVLSGLLAGEGGVEEAFIYGSWASRYHGKWGPPPADVDLLVVGELEPVRREAIETEAEALIGQPVQIVVVPRTEWDDSSDAFLQTVRERDAVPVAGRTTG